jgi:thiol-disulfide isomerase/thioredoxin
VRFVGVVVALLVATAPAFADAPPPLDEAIAQAASENKPLVLEFGADWCKPCRHFEQSVLPRADVKTALQHVVFVRYDIDESPGDLIAKQLDVVGVPTFVVLDGAGRVVERHSGSPLGSTAHVFFLELLMRAASTMPSSADLEAAVAASPDALVTRMTLARNYRAAGRRTDAAALFDGVANHPKASRELAAQAAAERDTIMEGEARIIAAVTRAESFVATYPDSPLSSFKLAMLGQTRRVARERLDDLAKAHLSLVPAAHLPNAVRAALLAGATTAAREAVEQRIVQPHASATTHLVHAELLMVSGGSWRDLEAEVEQGCAEPGNELWCYLLRQHLKRRGRVPPGMVQLRERAQRYLQALDDPSSRTTDFGLENVADVDAQFGNAVAIAFANARLACGYLATMNSEAVVVLDLRSDGRPRRVDVRSRDGVELERCVRRVVGAASLPAAPTELHHHLHGTILFDPPSNREPQYRKPPPLGAVMPQLVVRRGAIETYGFRGDFLIGTRNGDMRWAPAARTSSWMLGATVEIAGGDRGEPAYVARAHAGYRMPLLRLRHVFLMGLLGVGVSDLGTAAPRALELPYQAQIRIDLGGSLRVHVYAQSAWLFFAGERGGYEESYGGAVSFEVASRRVFLGGAYESRVAGESAMFTFGMPLGDLY